MKCALCGKGEVKVKTIKTSQEVKGEIVKFEAEALVCPECGGHYFDDELADRLAKAASNAYRTDHGLLTSDQIVAYRKELEMSQAEFAKFVPIAIASLKRYELFGIQDESADKLIRLRCDKKAWRDAGDELDFRISHKTAVLSARSN